MWLPWGNWCYWWSRGQNKQLLLEWTPNEYKELPSYMQLCDRTVLCISLFRLCRYQYSWRIYHKCWFTWYNLYSEVAYVNDDLYSAVMILILPSLFIYLQFGVIRVRKVLYMYCSSWLWLWLLILTDLFIIYWKEAIDCLFVSFHFIGCVVSYSFISGFQVECLRYVERASNSGGFYDSIVCGCYFSEGVWTCKRRCERLRECDN